MPRRKLCYTHLFPFHIYARANNKDWFYLPKSEMWKIFSAQGNCVFSESKFACHAFVLMDNHYHLLGSAHPDFHMGAVFQDFQKSVSRTTNRIAGRTNHLFGGPYKASMIRNEKHYAEVFKYIYSNPLRAGICSKVEDYPFSTLNDDVFGVSSPTTGIASGIPYSNILDWLNEPKNASHINSIRGGLRKTIFKPTSIRNY